MCRATQRLTSSSAILRWRGKIQRPLRPGTNAPWNSIRATRAHSIISASSLSSTATLVEAIPFFERALEIEPNDAKRHYLLARASFESGNTVRALAEVELALRLKPDQPEFIDLRNKIRGKL